MEDTFNAISICRISDLVLQTGTWNGEQTSAIRITGITDRKGGEPSLPYSGVRELVGRNVETVASLG